MAEIVNINMPIEGVVATFESWGFNDEGGYRVGDALRSVTVNGYEIAMPEEVYYTNVVGIPDEDVFAFAMANCEELRREVMAIPYTHME